MFKNLRFLHFKIKDKRRYKYIVVQYYNDNKQLCELVLPTIYLTVHNVGSYIHLSFIEQLTTLEVSKHYYIDSKFVKDIYWSNFFNEV